MPQQKPNFLTWLVLWTVVASMIWGCIPTRHLTEGQHLLVKNVIHLNENGRHKCALDEEDLTATLRQKPNRKLFGFVPFHLSVWNYAVSRDLSKKRNQYLQNTVGEAPVLFEPTLMEQSRENLKQMLANNGYFNARVEAVPVIGSDRVEVHYYIFSGPAYTMRKLNLSFEDTAMVNEFKTGLKSSFTSGDRFSTDQFDAERERIANYLKNRGYYTFEKTHVTFDVDTNLPGHRFDVTLKLLNLRVAENINGRDSIIEMPHRKHRIKSVVINQNYEAFRRSPELFSHTNLYGYTFLYLGKPYVRPVRIARNVFVEPGDLYSLQKSNYTYERLSALNTFTFIDIRYETSDEQGRQPGLDMRINLTRASRQSVTIETVGTNRSGNLGISTSLNYRNRNLFHGAEQLDMKVYGGLEAQRTNSTVENNANQVIGPTPFNTYEYGARLGLSVPDLMAIPRIRDIPAFKEPRTTYSVAFDRQARPQYQRTLLNTSWQYNMRFRSKDQFTFAPVDLSVIDLNKTPEFEKQLKNTGNSLLLNSYSDHIIAATKVSYAYTTQDLENELKNFYYYRTNFESAGNTLRLLSPVINVPYDENRRSYLIDSIAFAQYVKFDLDISKYYNLTPNSRYIVRFFGGMGVQLRNLNTLPFERAFFAGGANDIRAWQARGLGPGSLSDTATFGIDQVGELQLELNIEYRFKLIKQLEGAIFSDFGNIWLMRYDPLRPGAEFRANRFFREIAIAPGVGLRLNLNFFVIRFDVGMQLKDPQLPQGERWALFQPKTLTNQYREEARLRSRTSNIEPYTRPPVTANIAINYPF